LERKHGSEICKRKERDPINPIMSFEPTIFELMTNLYNNINCDDRINGYGKRGVYVQHTDINSVYNVTRVNCEPIRMVTSSMNILCDQIEETYPDCRYQTKALSQNQSNFLQQVNQMPSFHAVVNDYEPLRDMRISYENRNMLPDEQHINNDGSVRVMENDTHHKVDQILNPRKNGNKYTVFGSEFDEMTDQEKTNKSGYLPLKEVHLNNDSTFRVVNGNDVVKKENLIGRHGRIVNAKIPSNEK
jgi:hypothetical protein